MTENPPTIWATWNFADIDDPIAQVFAGIDINLDDFNRLNGPSKETRARSIGLNPVAAARYFRFVTHALLDGMFGIKVQTSRINRRKGLFGTIKSYYGLIEAQGRGSLHLHMFLWFANNPTSEELVELLKDVAYREKVKRFIERNIRAYVPGVTAEVFQNIRPENDVAWNRPPHPDEEDYNEKARELTQRVVRSQQMHACTKTTCLRYNLKTGKVDCKRSAPWSTSEEAYVQETGEWSPKRDNPYINGYCPDISITTCMNHDFKLQTNGKETKDGTFYTTKYTTKGQNNTHNMSAVVAKGFRTHESRSDYMAGVIEANRLMLFRCFMTINREIEFSGSQVITYLMGWGESVRSNDYTPLYWASIEAHIRRHVPALNTSNGNMYVALILNRTCVELM